MAHELTGNAIATSDQPAIHRCFKITLQARPSHIKVTEVARLTAGAVHPIADKPSLAYVVTYQAHVELVDRAVTEGKLRLFDPITFAALDHVAARRTVGGGNQCLACWDDFVSFATSLGIEVTDGAQANSESRDARCARLQARKVELKSKGVRAWLKTIVSEEGISASRVKQLLASS